MAHSMGPEITLASPDDVLEMEEVLYQTWLVTYPNEEHNVTEDDIHVKYRGRFDPLMIARRKMLVGSGIGGMRYLIARKESKIVGVCFVHGNEHFNHLQALYVLPGFQQQGVGGALWNEARKYLDLSRAIFLSVAVYNHRAIAIYTHLGFVRSGKEYIDERFRFKSGSIIPEIEMVLRPQ